jgi:DNA polymerase eta
VREKLLQKYPDLARVPPEGPECPLPPPCQIPWDGIGTVIPVSPDDEQRTEGEDGEVTGQVENPLTWHDVALSLAAEMMQNARDKIRETLGYSTSAVS